MDATEQKILETGERWAQALVSNDAERIGAFMADDWVIVGENGANGKEEFLSWVASGDLTHETMDLIGESRVVVYGDTAVLTARVANRGQYKTHPFSADEWTTDVFRRAEDGEWLCVLSHVTATRTA